MRRFLTAVAAIMVGALAASSCGGGANGEGGESAATPPEGSSGLAPFYAQRVSWHDCKGGFQCSTVRVPLDYDHPDGDELKLAVIRLPAQGSRIGSLLTNPGGPGGSGVDFVRNAAASFGAKVRARFDIVGFDPRGVGQSDPIRCVSAKQLDAYFATDTSPDTTAEEHALAMRSKAIVKGCEAKSGDLLPHVGTVDAAKDMDVLRAALGDKRLTYYGASYGTYLGASYAEQFPTRVRAMVLDGALDPKMSAAEVNIEQAKGFETALRAFAADCVKDSGCPLGTSGTDDAIARVAELIDSTDDKPLKNTNGDGRKVTQSLTVLGIAAALYSKQTWRVLRAGLRTAINGRDGTILLKLADFMVERENNGRYSNQTESNMAINCIDKPNPNALGAWEKEADRAEKRAPRFGDFVVWGSLLCAYWPVPPNSKPHALHAKGAKPIVVVGTTRDPATPYQWAQNLASELDSGVLLSLDGDGHTAYLQGNSCITAAVDRYLITEKPPKPNTMCH